MNDNKCYIYGDFGGDSMKKNASGLMIFNVDLK
jgi:hypothetical protein